MAVKHSTLCSICSKEFILKTHKANKFCSLPCYRISQRQGNYKRSHRDTTFRAPCHYCSKEVIGQLSKKRNGEKSENIFCNRICYDSYRAKKIIDRQVACTSCGILCQPSITRGYKPFCNDNCKKAYKKAKPKHCVNCNCLFTPVKCNSNGKMISHNSGKTCSAKCGNEWISNNEVRKQKISFAFTREKHPNWQGGSHNMCSRGSGWIKLRLSIKVRDNFTCRHCGMTEEQSMQVYKCGLHVNHIKPFHQFGGKTVYANKPSNLESLCCSCHTITDAKWRRDNSVQLSLAGMFHR